MSQIVEKVPNFLPQDNVNYYFNVGKNGYLNDTPSSHRPPLDLKIVYLLNSGLFFIFNADLPPLFDFFHNFQHSFYDSPKMKTA